MSFDLERLHARLRAAGPPPSFDHLRDLDADTLRRDVGGDDVVEDAKPAKGRRRTSLTSAIRAAKAAGMTVTGARITDGTIVLTFGDDSTVTASDNPWDKALRRAPN